MSAGSMQSGVPPLSVRRIKVRPGLVTYAAWITLGAALIAPRAAALTQGLWHDEIYTIQNYVSGGPAAIFGRYGTNDHMLFSLLSWVT